MSMTAFQLPLFFYLFFFFHFKNKIKIKHKIVFHAMVRFIMQYCQAMPHQKMYNINDLIQIDLTLPSRKNRSLGWPNVNLITAQTQFRLSIPNNLQQKQHAQQFIYFGPKTPSAIVYLNWVKTARIKCPSSSAVAVAPKIYTNGRLLDFRSVALCFIQNTKYQYRIKNANV